MTAVLRPPEVGLLGCQSAEVAPWNGSLVNGGLDCFLRRGRTRFESW